MSNETKVSFVSEEDGNYIKKLKLKSYKVKVALHELLGHGSGKILRKDKDGKFNFEEGNSFESINWSLRILIFISPQD